MTVRELSLYLKMNERTIYGWARKGQIPVYKTPGCFRFKKEEIETWMKGNEGKAKNGKGSERKGIKNA